MKNIDSISNTTQQSVHLHSNHFESQSTKSHIQVATILIDQVTDALFSSIENGDLQVQDQQTPLQTNNQKINNLPKHVVQFKFINPQEHKKIMKKFIKQNLQQTKQRRIRSLQNDQKEKKYQQQQMKMKQQIRNKSIEQRRKQIQKRLNQKKQVMRQISKSIIQSSTKISQIRKKKFLYQTKQQQQYYKQRAQMEQAERLIIAKKRNLREPMHLQQILNHEKQYETLRLKEQNQRIAKIKISKMHDSLYNPPNFVPASFKMMEQEQFIKEKQQQLKKKQIQLLGYKKKQYIKKIQQIQQKKRQNSMERSRSFSPHSLVLQQKNQNKLDREQVKDIGNNYLKEVLQNSKKLRSSRKLKSTRVIQQSSTQLKPKRNKSLQKSKILIQAQMEVLRNKKIQEIIKTEKLSGYQKCHRLKKQFAKLDQTVANKMKVNQDIIETNKSAQILLSSINAKIAFLYFAQS